METWCSGLDGLVERAKKYYAQGARFAKWRAVLQITSDGAPSALSIQVCVLLPMLYPLIETKRSLRTLETETTWRIWWTSC